MGRSPLVRRGPDESVVLNTTETLDSIMELFVPEVQGDKLDLLLAVLGFIALSITLTFVSLLLGGRR